MAEEKYNPVSEQQLEPIQVGKVNLNEEKRQRNMLVWVPLVWETGRGLAWLLVCSPGGCGLGGFGLFGVEGFGRFLGWLRP